MYTAEGVFLPPQNSLGSRWPSQSQLGSLGATGALGGLKSPGDVYIGILASRTGCRWSCKEVDLQKFYKTKRFSDSAKKLQTRLSKIDRERFLLFTKIEIDVDIVYWCCRSHPKCC